MNALDYRQRILSAVPTLLAVLCCINAFRSNALWCLMNSTDSGWLIRSGQYICEHQQLPVKDLFSWTAADKPWVLYQWVSECFAWLIYKAGGLWLVGQSWLLMVAILFFWLLPRQMILRGAPPFIAFGLLSLTLTPSWFFARPQIFSYFFLLGLQSLVLHYQEQKGWKILLLVPPLMIAWANIHSFWIFGIIMILVACLRSGENKNWLQLDLPMALCLVAALLSVCVNPYGFDLIKYNFSFVGNTELKRIQEVGPIEFGFFNQFIAYITVFAALTLRTWRQTPFYFLAVSWVFLVLAVCVQRYVPLAVIVSAPHLGFLVGQFLKNNFPSGLPSMSSRMLQIFENAALPALAVGAALVIWPLTCPNEEYADALFRHSRVNDTLKYYVANRLPADRVFNDADTGDWLILHQAGPVFMDTRFDFYGKAFFNRFYDCLEGSPGWDTFLKKLGVTHLLMKGRPKVIDQLESSPEWSKVKDDGHVTLWKRRAAVP